MKGEIQVEVRPLPDPSKQVEFYRIILEARLRRASHLPHQ